MGSFSRIFAVVILVLLAFSTACKKEDPVSLLMAELEEAVEARDARRMEKRLSSEFLGNDEMNREEALDVLRRYFLAYESIGLNVTNVNRQESGTQVNFHVTFSGKVNSSFNLQNLLPSTAAYDFELRLVQEDGILKVRKAYWWNKSP
jgi:hypothetical protein